MTYWFKPNTHWHEVTKEGYETLLAVGYKEGEHLKKEDGDGRSD